MNKANAPDAEMPLGGIPSWGWLTLPDEWRFLEWLAGARGLLRRLQAGRWTGSQLPPDPPAKHQHRQHGASQTAKPISAHPHGLTTGSR